MKAHITLTTDAGEAFEGDVVLLPAGTARTREKKVKQTLKRTAVRSATTPLDFSVNERAFVKAHGRGLSGQKKFVLLVAYLAHGQVGKEVQLGDVQKQWNKMTRLLGGRFNRFYSNTAKDNGWVDTRKKGVYVLTQSWKQALAQDNG